MQYLIAQAFDIKSDFTINALQKCPVTGQEKPTAIWSDGDLDAAIKNVTPEAYLRLRYELTTREEGQCSLVSSFALRELFTVSSRSR